MAAEIKVQKIEGVYLIAKEDGEDADVLAVNEEQAKALFEKLGAELGEETPQARQDRFSRNRQSR